MHRQKQKAGTDIDPNADVFRERSLGVSGPSGRVEKHDASPRGAGLIPVGEPMHRFFLVDASPRTKRSALPVNGPKRPNDCAPRGLRHGRAAGVCEARAVEACAPELVEGHDVARRFFLLLGYLRRDRCRFLSDNEIQRTMEDVFKTYLTAAERSRYTVNADVWPDLRANNERAVVSCRVSDVRYHVFTSAELKADHRKLQYRAYRSASEKVGKQVTEGLSDLLPLLGANLAKKVYKRVSLVAPTESLDDAPAKRPQSKYFRIANVTFRVFRLQSQSFRDALSAQATQAWRTFAIPGDPPAMVVGLQQVERSVVVSVSGVPTGFDAKMLLQWMRSEESVGAVLAGARASFARLSPRTGSRRINWC